MWEDRRSSEISWRAWQQQIWGGGGALIPWRSKAGYQAAGDLALVAKQAAVCFAGAIEAGPREPLCEGVAPSRRPPAVLAHPPPKASRTVRLRARVHRGDGGGGVLGQDDGGVGVVGASDAGPRVSRASK